jgi:hypothetical protein
VKNGSARRIGARRPEYGRVTDVWRDNGNARGWQSDNGESQSVALYCRSEVGNFVVAMYLHVCADRPMLRRTAIRRLNVDVNGVNVNSSTAVTMIPM